MSTATSLAKELSQVELLKNQGVTFDNTSELEAAHYLAERCNYKKLIPYSQLYAKHITGAQVGKFIHLDFDQLRLLASLDQQLREVLGLITLDIEHFHTVGLMHEIGFEKESEHELVTAYFETLEEPYKTIRLGEIKRAIDSNASTAVDNFALKNLTAEDFLGLASFGTIIDFTRFCALRWGNKELNHTHYDLKQVKVLRNYAAHKACVLSRLNSQIPAKPAPSACVMQTLIAAGIPKESRRKWMKRQVTMQMAVTLITYSKTVPPGRSRTRATEALEILLNRATRSKELLSKSCPDGVAGGAFSFIGNLTRQLKLVE